MFRVAPAKGKLAEISIQQKAVATGRAKMSEQTRLVSAVAMQAKAQPEVLTSIRARIADENRLKTFSPSSNNRNRRGAVAIRQAEMFQARLAAGDIIRGNL